MDVTLTELALIAFAAGVGVFVLVLGARSAEVFMKVVGIVGGVGGILLALITLVE